MQEHSGKDHFINVIITAFSQWKTIPMPFLHTQLLKGIQADVFLKDCKTFI